MREKASGDWRGCASWDAPPATATEHSLAHTLALTCAPAASTLAPQEEEEAVRVLIGSANPGWAPSALADTHLAGTLPCGR